MKFLSTSPARGTTFHCVTSISYYADFYPRPPRGGRRAAAAAQRWAAHHFYPRPPRGGRLYRFATWSRSASFLSTSPARGTTAGCPAGHRRTPISIHVPREGDDRWHSQLFGVRYGFLSTSPARGTTFAGVIHPTMDAFLSTSPARGTTSRRRLGPQCFGFLSTSPARGTTGNGSRSAV